MTILRLCSFATLIISLLVALFCILYRFFTRHRKYRSNQEKQEEQIIYEEQ